MYKFFSVLTLVVTCNAQAGECFNASQLAEQGQYVAAPGIEAAIIASASDIGWNVEKSSAMTASYAIVGMLGIVRGDDLMVCVAANAAGSLDYLAYPSKAGREGARSSPLQAVKR